MARNKAGNALEFFFVTKEKVGSEVKMISFKEGTSEPVQTVHVD